MTDNVPAVIENKGMVPYLRDFNDEEIHLIRTVLIPRMAPHATDRDIVEFIYTARKQGLDPFCKQIYLVPRGNGHSIQVSIDGLRLMAQRNKQYAGQLGPEWCGPDGQWVDVWTKKDLPTAARVAVLRHDFKAPLWSVALFESYAQYKSSGELNPFWKRSPSHMLAKCCEALSIRRGCPNETSGYYIPEEMHNIEVTEINLDPNADNSDVETKVGQVVDTATIVNTQENRNVQHNAEIQTAAQLEDIQALVQAMPSEFFAGLLTYVNIPVETRIEALTETQANALLDSYETWYTTPISAVQADLLKREREAIIELAPELDLIQLNAFRATLCKKERGFTVKDGILLSKKHRLIIDTLVLGRKCAVDTDGTVMDRDGAMLLNYLNNEQEPLLHIFLKKNEKVLADYRAIVIDTLDERYIKDDQALRDRVIELKTQRAQELDAA